MAKKIYGDLSSSGNIQINGLNTIREINDLQADSTGDINIPYYDKLYIENMISMSPLTRVGTQDYLPINVSSVAVPTTSTSKNSFPTILENDGTLVILRPTNNGSTERFYYSYLKNARIADDLTPINTNLEYRPSFFTSSYQIDDFIASKSDQVLMMKIINGSNLTYAIALTNGTFDQDYHSFLEFDRSLIPNTNPNYIHIVGDLIYIWCIDSYNKDDAFNISLYTLSTSDVINGSTASLNAVSGISGNNLFGSVVSNSNHINVVNTIVSKSSTDSPLILEDDNTNTNPFYITSYGLLNAECNESNSDVRVSIVHRFYAEASFGSKSDTYGISFTYNIDTKSYSFDTLNNGSIKIESTNNVIEIDNPYSFDLENYNGYNSNINAGTSLFQTNDGIVFSSNARYVDYDYYSVIRGKIDNFTTLYNSLNVNYRTLSDIINSNIVVESNNEPIGFKLFFNQDMPVLINGSFYQLSKTIVDLTTIDSSPANKTFYVYVVNLEGEANYFISTTLLSEELWRVYIGTVVTGASSISTISIEKVTRFLTYRTSTTKKGSAIPTSTGVPSAPGTRWN